MCRLTFILIIICNFVFADNLLIGIAGGSGAGKTTLAKKIKESFENDVIIISQDNYYKDRSDVSLKERKEINYDHPDAIDFNLLKEDLLLLKNNESINEPIYDFVTSARKKETLLTSPKKNYHS